jgi:hypothetical protein
VNCGKLSDGIRTVCAPARVALRFNDAAPTTWGFIEEFNRIYAGELLGFSSDDSGRALVRYFNTARNTMLIVFVPVKAHGVFGSSEWCAEVSSMAQEICVNEEVDYGGSSAFVYAIARDN